MQDWPLANFACSCHVLIQLTRATRDTLPANCIDATEPNAIGMAAFGKKWHDSSDISGATNWAEGTVLADACYSALRDVGRYVGMAATARDAMAIVDALKEDGMLRYWGRSLNV